MNALSLWLAQGCGVGRLRPAPGTFGSLAGLLWFALLSAAHNFPLLLAGSAAGLVLSIWLSGRAEKILAQRDPGSVVIDEIAAIPLCFIGWSAVHLWKTGIVAGPEFFFSGWRWAGVAGVFAAFRFFDIVKPTPVRQSQRLPGGWGVTIDDTLAALYVNVITVPICIAAY